MRKREEKNQFRKQKGITLIALVVTIIVLIILAGVSINLVLGDNGIITKAKEAKEKTEQAKENEKYDLAEFEDSIYEAETGIKIEKVIDENPGILEGTGTEQEPYLINSIEDLVVFANDVTNGNTYEGKIVKLGSSLDFNSSKSYVNALRTDFAEYGYEGELKTALTTANGFIGIGTYSIIKDDSENDITNEKSFEGIFDGDNKSISGLKSINGLFGFNYGTIKKLIIKGKIVNDQRAGAVCLYNYGTVTECQTYVDINAISNSGGIVGINMNGGTISESYNYGNVTGNGSTIGGICGYNYGGIITHCVNKGMVVNKRQQNSGHTGGIAGSNSGELSYCYNSGEVSASSDLCGGICGITDKVVKYCYNDGTVSSTTLIIGGIAGYAYSANANISYCYNVGEVIGQRRTGGIIGELNTGATINNCYSKCVMKYPEAGGICGIIFEPSTILNCEWYSENVEYGIASLSSNENAVKNPNVYIPNVIDII